VLKFLGLPDVGNPVNVHNDCDAVCKDGLLRSIGKKVESTAFNFLPSNDIYWLESRMWYVYGSLEVEPMMLDERHPVPDGVV